MKKISVVIPVFNSRNTIRRCLDNIFRLDDPNYEVIVVNDTSTDETPSICSEYDLKLIDTECRQGPAVARNIGAKESSGDIIAFTDSDCMVDPDWLSRIRTRMVEENNDIITGRYKVIASQNIIGRFISYDDYNYYHKHLPPLTDILTGGNFAIKKSIMSESPGIEEQVFGHYAAAEDTILGHTLSKKYDIVYDSELAVGHICPENIIPYLKKSTMRGCTKTVIMIIFRDRIMKFMNVHYSYVIGHVLLTLLLIFSFYFAYQNNNPILLLPGCCAYLLYVIANDLVFFYREEKRISLLLISLPLLFLRSLFWMVGAIMGLMYCMTSFRTLRAKKMAYDRW